jgi:hypothetical protein
MSDVTHMESCLTKLLWNAIHGVARFKDEDPSFFCSDSWEKLVTCGLTGAPLSVSRSAASL